MRSMQAKLTLLGDEDDAEELKERVEFAQRSLRLVRMLPNDAQPMSRKTKPSETSCAKYVSTPMPSIEKSVSLPTLSETRVVLRKENGSTYTRGAARQAR